MSATGGPPPAPGASADAVRRWSATELRAAGVPSPEADAAAIVSHILGVPPAAIVLAGPPSATERDRIAALLRRRVTREPLQHLLGTAAFGRLDLAVGPGVFVPRPETEVLVGHCARLAPPGPVVVDLCSGSGAIALALATELPGAEVFAVELSADALIWLRRNVAAHAESLAAAGSTVTVVQADAATDPREWLPPSAGELAGRVDLVTCNPPYIPEDCVPRDPEVARFDPDIALYGGPDGLAVVRGVIRTAACLLRSGGWLAVEHGDEQGSGPLGVPAAIEEAGGFVEVADVADLTGRPRVTLARRA